MEHANPDQNSRPSATAFSKRQERAEKFKRIGQAITAQMQRDRNGQHNYEIRGRAIQDPAISSRMFGPQTKSQQWERTSK